jgi:DNA repair exonuclease SbcCD ATPase subunit
METETEKSEKGLSYIERMKERQRIISELNNYNCKLEKLKQRIEDNKQKMEDIKKELEKSNSEKTKLENYIKDLNEELIKNGIPVPEETGKYEISNGILGMKRDINLKLILYLYNDKIQQVYFLLI